MEQRKKEWAGSLEEQKDFLEDPITDKFRAWCRTLWDNQRDRLVVLSRTAPTDMLRFEVGILTGIDRVIAELVEEDDDE